MPVAAIYNRSNPYFEGYKNYERQQRSNTELNTGIFSFANDTNNQDIVITDTNLDSTPNADNHSLSDTVFDIAHEGVDLLEEGVNWVKDKFSPKPNTENEGVLDGLGRSLGSGLRTIGKGISSIGEGLGDIISGAGRAIGGGLKKIGNWLKDLFKKKDKKKEEKGNDAMMGWNSSYNSGFGADFSYGIQMLSNNKGC